MYIYIYIYIYIYFAPPNGRLSRPHARACVLHYHYAIHVVASTHMCVYAVHANMACVADTCSGRAQREDQLQWQTLCANGNYRYMATTRQPNR